MSIALSSWPRAAIKETTSPKTRKGGRTRASVESNNDLNRGVSMPPFRTISESTLSASTTTICSSRHRGVEIDVRPHEQLADCRPMCDRDEQHDSLALPYAFSDESGESYQATLHRRACAGSVGGPTSKKSRVNPAGEAPPRAPPHGGWRLSSVTNRGQRVTVQRGRVCAMKQPPRTRSVTMLVLCAAAPSGASSRSRVL
jgi:hypothetical protein